MKKTAKKPAKKTTKKPAKAAAPIGSAFTKTVDVPEPTPLQTKARAAAKVVSDSEQRTAIELRREGQQVVYVPNADYGLQLERATADSFDKHFKALDYPVGRAARLYVEFATQLGGTSEAMSELANLVQVTAEEIEMATTKQTKKTSAAPTAKKPAAKANGKDHVKAGPKGSGIGEMFRELIMAGKMTDTEIFKKVQSKFGLEDHKRSHVSWYRMDLRRKGKNPPAPVKTA